MKIRDLIKEYKEHKEYFEEAKQKNLLDCTERDIISAIGMRDDGFVTKLRSALGHGIILALLAEEEEKGDK